MGYDSYRDQVVQMVGIKPKGPGRGVGVSGGVSVFTGPFS